jgi:FKBP-type peptidyl-prolyl cis-trans isomerase (trigger factor)
MDVSITKLPQSEVEVSGEVSVEELEAAFKKALAEAQVNAEMPGFRKGQVPVDLVLREVGEDRILHRAAEFALGKAWPEAIEAHHLQAIGLPDIQVLKLARGNPLLWKARVGILPEIELPDYRAIARRMRTESVLQSRNSDISRSDESITDFRDSDMSNEGGIVTEKNNVPGASIGDNKKSETKEDPQREKEKQRLALLEKIASETKLEIPPALAEAEKIKMIGELRAGLEGMGLKWEDYLNHIKKNEKEIVEGFAAEAEKRARFGLVLREIAKREHIDPTREEVEARVRQIVPSYSSQEQKALDKDRIAAYAYGVLRNEKVFELLENLEKRT